MRAIILAGGQGKRLRPITDYVPKPLVPICNVPILEWQLRYLQRSGVDEAVICTGYRKEMIENYLEMRKTGVKIRYSIEESPLGTGGAIKRAAAMIDDESFYVLNGDVITDIDMQKLPAGGNTVAAIELRTKFGVMEADGEMITGFREKRSVPGTWMNAGIYRLQRGVVADLPDCGEIEKTVFPDYAQRGLLSLARFPDARWHSIDSFKDIEECALEVEDILG